MKIFAYLAVGLTCILAFYVCKGFVQDIVKLIRIKRNKKNVTSDSDLKGVNKE